MLETEAKLVSKINKWVSFISNKATFANYTFHAFYAKENEIFRKKGFAVPTFIAEGLRFCICGYYFSSL